MDQFFLSAQIDKLLIFLRRFIISHNNRHQCPEMVVHMARIVEPVSYTHLDVYKRQIMNMPPATITTTYMRPSKMRMVFWKAAIYL